MKTAMQELIEKIDLQIEEEKSLKSIGIEIWGLFQAKNLARDILEKEKEQIIEAYCNGHNDGCRYMNNEKQEFEHAEEYYNQTYNQNK